MLSNVSHQSSRACVKCVLREDFCLARGIRCKLRGMRTPVFVLVAWLMTVLPTAVMAKESPRKNVLGGALVTCCDKPKTGYMRDGMCRAVDDDHGTHTVCAVVTQAFLEFTRSRGNDLITPRPQGNFPGLKANDRWCLCALRWREALAAKVAPPLVLESTDERTLDFIPLETLQAHALSSAP